MNNNELIENSWYETELINYLEFKPPLKDSLYQKVGEIIDELHSEIVLDYGCGAGNQIAYLLTSTQVDIFDITREYVDTACKTYKDTHRIVPYYSTNEIPNNQYDAFILNLVWLCLRNEEEMNELFDTIRRIVKRNGHIIVTITNPYAEDMEFSYYKSEFTTGEKEFNYFKNGEPYKVYIKDSTKSVFIDYHWTFEFTLNKFISNKFELVKFMELKDIPFHNDVNYKLNPYFLLVFRNNN